VINFLQLKNDFNATLTFALQCAVLVRTPAGWWCCSNKGEDEMVEYFQNKYSGESVARILGDGEEMSDEITQQGLLPGVK